MNIKSFLNNYWVQKSIYIIILIAVNLVIYNIIVAIINKNLDNNTKLVKDKKIKTYIKLLRSIIRYIFIIGTLLIILQIIGINISSIVAGVGVLGAIIGLAIQDFLKDIIRGSTILSDNYFSVGDIVKYKDIEGKVLVLGLKTTKIKDLVTNNVISIANRNIEEIEVVSNIIYVRVPIPYEVPVKKAEKAIEDIITLTKEYDKVEEVLYLGTTELKDSSVEYLLQVKCNPINKNQVKRDTIKSILLGLEKNKIEVPFNQIDVHQK